MIDREPVLYHTVSLDIRTVSSAARILCQTPWLSSQNQNQNVHCWGRGCVGRIHFSVLPSLGASKARRITKLYSAVLDNFPFLGACAAFPLPSTPTNAATVRRPYTYSTRKWMKIAIHQIKDGERPAQIHLHLGTPLHDDHHTVNLRRLARDKTQ